MRTLRSPGPPGVTRADDDARGVLDDVVHPALDLGGLARAAARRQAVGHETIIEAD